MPVKHLTDMHLVTYKLRKQAALAGKVQIFSLFHKQQIDIFISFQKIAYDRSVRSFKSNRLMGMLLLVLAWLRSGTMCNVSTKLSKKSNTHR